MLRHSPFDFNKTGHFELDDHTPLMWASTIGRTDFVQLFIENANQCEIDLAKGIEGCFAQFTPLHTACFNGHADVVDLLLNNATKYGLPIGTGGHLQLSTLHSTILTLGNDGQGALILRKEAPEENMFIRMKKLKVLELLLNHPVAQACIDFNVFSNEDNPKTALHLACTQGFPEMVKLLVENANKNGIDVFARDGSGNTPIEIAHHYDHDELLELLPTHEVDDDNV